MEIDKWSTAGSDEHIVLFPRSYNKRGDERLHSVQGVTLDGREVNIKLRVDASVANREAIPSIAEFSREDVKAKNPCLAFADNGPDNREGILLFTGCEEDGENRRGIQSYTARWAYVLASHSDSPEPVYGLGRIVMIADSHAAKQIHSELTELEKNRPEGWHAIAEHKRKALNDPMLFSYYGHIYHTELEECFKDTQQLTDFAVKTFEGFTGSGIVGGLLIRMQDSNGVIVPGFSVEVFPRWIGNNEYQKADDVMMWFYRTNSKRIKENEGAEFLAMPIKRYSCGPSFKNYYFLKRPEESLQKIRKRYLINNEPTTGLIALALSRKEENGDCFLLKYYPLSNPLSPVGMIGFDSQQRNHNPDELSGLDPATRIRAGLAAQSAIAFPAWYTPGSIFDIERSLESELGSPGDYDQDDLSTLFEELSDEDLQVIKEQELSEAPEMTEAIEVDTKDMGEAIYQKEFDKISPTEGFDALSISPSVTQSSDDVIELNDDNPSSIDAANQDPGDEKNDERALNEDHDELNLDDLEDGNDSLPENNVDQDKSLYLYDSTTDGSSTYFTNDESNSQHAAEENEGGLPKSTPPQEIPEELTGLARFMKNKGLL